MTVDDETLIAYVDGELDPPRRAALEAAMKSDPELAGRVEAHRALRERVRQAYAGEPQAGAAPDPLIAMIAAGGPEPSAELIDLSARRAQRQAASAAAAERPTWSWRQAAAMAACLVLGVVVARSMWRPADGPGPIRVDSRGLVARGELAESLSTRLSSEAAAASPVQVGLSFRARDGGFCRTFRAESRAGATAGVACRDGDLWRVRIAAETAPQAGGDRFRTAASGMPAAVTAAVDSMIEGDALDAKGEAEARARGWRPVR